MDVSRLLDEGEFTGFQMLLVAGAALTIILDGIDNLLLSPAVPTLMDHWGLERGAFSTALAASPFGMMIGGALGGWLGDRFGRRTALLGSVLTFATLTMCLALAEGVAAVTVLRFLAGFGLGGAMPNATALASEYVPRRQRPFAVTLTIVCIPFGGMLAAFLASHLLPSVKTYFVVGGAIPLVIGLMLFFVLPESPRFLAGRPERWRELAKLLRRFGHDMPDDATFVGQAAAAQSGKAGSYAEVFGEKYLGDTLALIVAFLFCLMVNYIGLLLLPTALTSVGFTSENASRALGWWTMGGVVGALCGAFIIQKVGSRFGMLGISALAIVTAVAVAMTRLDPGNLYLLAAVCVVLGASLNAVQVAEYALAAHVYPTEIRSRGIGAVISIARVGNVLAPYVAMAALDKGGVAAYFATFAVGMGVVFVALALVRRHIEPSSAAAPPMTAVGAAEE